MFTTYVFTCMLCISHSYTRYTSARIPIGPLGSNDRSGQKPRLKLCCSCQRHLTLNSRAPSSLGDSLGPHRNFSLDDVSSVRYKFDCDGLTRLNKTYLKNMLYSNLCLNNVDVYHHLSFGETKDYIDIDR